MWILIALVVVAAVLMVLVSRRQPDDATTKVVADVHADGLVVDGRTLTWSSIDQVAVVTRRELGGTWYGFDVRTEEVGSVLVDPEDGLAERFLAEMHRLPGFDHDSLQAALVSRTRRVVCYSRW